MLVSIHVKNLAIIDEIEVDFSEGLNILTGETGAGKSIIIGSVTAALGGKIQKDIVRAGCDYGLIEVVFSIENQMQRDAIEALDIPVEEDMVIISRKIMSNRTVNRINGETVPASRLKEVALILIDIHGQHEHQSLLDRQKHLEIVDRYLKQKVDPIKEQLQQVYKEYVSIKKEIQSMDMPEEERLRQLSFMEFELEEIENAQLQPGEEAKLEEQYKELVSHNQIRENLALAYSYIEEKEGSASEMVSMAVRALSSIRDGGKTADNFLMQLTEIEALLSDFSREASGFLSDMQDNREELDTITKRLDTIRSIKAKYGTTTSEVMAYGKELEEKIEKYKQYGENLEKLETQKERSKEELENLSLSLSKVRKEGAAVLEKLIVQALVDLNFLDVQFMVSFSKADGYSANGYDVVEFMISTNPGEPVKQLIKAASGGELSRVMLAIKAVLAAQDEIPTLIFDEIDVGISGRTAQKVSEKLAFISKTHQIVCITHLAQIASMADSHYLIEKTSNENHTSTIIRKLQEDEQVNEIARILGGAKITDVVLASAKEMKMLAKEMKNK